MLAWTGAFYPELRIDILHVLFYICYMNALI